MYLLESLGVFVIEFMCVCGRAQVCLLESLGMLVGEFIGVFVEEFRCVCWRVWICLLENLGVFVG